MSRGPHSTLVPGWRSLASSTTADPTHRYRDPQRSTVPASPHPAGKTQNSSPMRWLTDTRVRLGLGAAAVLVTALPARRDRVGHGEAQIFRAINGLPDPLYGPVWVVMQLGALGAVPAAAAAALLAHDRELAGRLLAGGTAPGPCPSWSNRWCADPGQRRWSAAPAPAAAMLLASVTCRATRAWRWPWARLHSRD